MIELVEFSIVIVGVFLSMCMFSTLYGKSSPLYALAEESYLGFATGLTVVVNVLYIYRTGILGIQAGDSILIIGVILGLLTWTRIHPKYAYISRFPIAITLGAQFGLAMRTVIFTGFIDQIKATIKPLLAGTGTALLYNWTVFLFVVFTLSYFLYTIELKGALGTSATIGEYLMYAAFGAIFAQTFMGRLSLFVGFMQNYAVPPWKTPYLIGSMVTVFALVALLDKANILNRLTPEE